MTREDTCQSLQSRALSLGIEQWLYFTEHTSQNELTKDYHNLTHDGQLWNVLCEYFGEYDIMVKATLQFI